MDTTTHKNPKFEYVRPVSVSQAVQFLNDPAFTSKILAGGTDLIASLREKKPNFDRLVDISRLSELKSVCKVDQTIFLGAGVTFSQAIQNEILKKHAPLLVEAFRTVGGPQIRNIGTVGGNVANAASCADSLPALMCLDTMAHLCGCQGERKIPVVQIVVESNQTLIEPGEILTHFTFEIPPEGTRASFIKLARRNALAISRVTVAALGGLDDQGRIDNVKISIGAATPQAARFLDVERTLIGQRPSPEILSRAARLVADSVMTITGRRWSSEYKEKAVAAITEQALTRIFLR
jgi:CO/xanthine dehydrogenase FAD-binding subunit